MSPLRRNWPHSTLNTSAVCLDFLFVCSDPVVSSHCILDLHLRGRRLQGDGRQLCGAGHTCTEGFPNAPRLLTEHRLYSPNNNWISVRGKRRANRVCREHDTIITEQGTIAYRHWTIISMWYEAIIVFRTSNVKLLPGWSRLPALSVQVRGSSQWPRASVVFIAGAPRKCAFPPVRSARFGVSGYCTEWRVQG